MGLRLRAAELACADYRREGLLSACAVLGLAAVLAPLLILYGVKFGVVETLTARLLHNPATLEISPVGSGRYTADYVASLGRHPAVAFALLFSYVKSRTNQAAETVISVFSSTAVALGIFIATMNGSSFTKFNKYLIGDILSVTPGEIGLLAAVLLAVIVLWIFASNRLVLTAVHPQLASSRGIPVRGYETLFTVSIAVVVTLAMSWVGLMVINSLLVLPAAAARNVARNLREYHLFSVVLALIAGVLGLVTSYYLGSSTGAVISLYLAVFFAVTFLFRKRRA